MENCTRSSFESTLHETETPFLTTFEKSSDYTNYRTSRRVQLGWAVIAPWVLSLLLLAVIVIIEIRVNGLIGGPPFGYWTAHELEIAKREIPATLKQIRFTGGLRYNESKQLYREIELGVPDYSGIPTPEIDAAWHDLISTTDVFLTEEEVKANIENGGTFANFPRPDDSLYTDPFTGLYQAVTWGRFLASYSIMCASDMTPIPEAHTDFKPNGNLEPIFQIEHTCRDYSAIQKWAKGRDALDDTVWRKNAEKLKPGLLS
ncbi:hypothetical protein UA08_03512 [Talaromyces atroroseus]|uniref:Uncharacterized protein n=1 Tax=Talaromyces atroroseus TaxID=1441469 RepID=A0A225AJF6_TALAT|nr:hypothetical protein UA08_03512 [Talaromyces atroroseus]OKL61631.1 hypothetical protein UA08_03512 [Talaromyces atroroseus]